ncbi:ABC transporter ATP-binding protein [uncultured Dubosiella sp.]|jgi:ABC-type multidrug transport system fused ATPase/permease subunit|uniref:ATP-binding cassette domain-containing protein n=1 Tax=uncultured Dubosiella sp. TaxID=1937011 RepID=UPI002628ACF1|nr:ABC transporter ATP-binding protein [uncultured Dubosiella sp.]
MIFDHVNLNVSQGEKIVIEGESGKGKSTLMKVIAGLYAPTKGTILYKDPLSISYVPQDPSLFTGTILENIRMGNGCAGKQAIEEAAKKAGLHEWIESLPHSYDTHLDVLGKQNLSQGQMQRIAIARALLRKADLYLFDEIASALDPVTENKILDTIESMDGAVLLISHKENVLARFDRKIRI